ncbi:uncharacterized protein LOC123318965 isoform X2 [Coccinella septempunctata]|uniref:uncharacterized protein LOC123318965 isoform X2 n=1 Tax=Coccinella septempunctata TaxID=41139 RepID=UPI001D05F18F|nr:uncharacterized protein LOC123318965 isoform X2 [Coccinella septempunctata]
MFYRVFLKRLWTTEATLRPFKYRLIRLFLNLLSVELQYARYRGSMILCGRFGDVVVKFRLVVMRENFDIVIWRDLEKKFGKNLSSFRFSMDNSEVKLAFLSRRSAIWPTTSESRMVECSTRSYARSSTTADMVAQFPGRVIDAELPKLPRPEIGKILASSLFGKKNVFHPALKEKYQNEDLITIMSRIQQHVLKNRLRVNEFFRDFDPLRCGKITTSQFHRGLDSLGISGIQRMFLSLPEIETLITQYRDPTDPMRVCWQTFEDDVDQVFTTKNLEKTPELEVNPPSQEVQLLQRKGTKAWHQVNTPRRDLCEEALDKIKKRVLKRGLLLKPSFRDYDKTNNGHVTIPNARQCLVTNGILLSDEELYALEERYNSDMGFNYFWFLKEVEPKREEVPLYQGLYAKTKAVNAPPPKKPPTRAEKDIVQILAKIKAKVVRDRIRVIEFLRDFDRCNEQVVKREDFKRGLSDCRFGLSENEMDTLMDVFASPLRRECIDYRKFSDVIEESFTQSCLERAPLIVPLQHVPTKDCEKSFLNFEERRAVSVALQKLAKKPDLQMNLLCVFQDYDKSNCGTVTREQFLKALHMRGMADLVSTNEFEVICKCFGFERGMRDEVDYRSFIKALDVLYATDKYTPI